MPQILGTFDYILIGLLLLSMIYIYSKQIAQKPGCIIGALLFGVILPAISMKIEFDRGESLGVEWDDYTILYTYFRFPIYWGLGGIFLAVLSEKRKRAKE